MVAKLRLGACLMPFYSLLCSSGAFLEGGQTVGVERARIWFETDRDRTGYPSIIFDKDFGYRSWIEYALDVPMYFLRRNEKYISVAGASFRDFMAHGLKGERATLRDFADHLTTIFTEVRLKPFLELRSPDCLPKVYVSAITALSYALFYNENACAQAMSIFGYINKEELSSLHVDVMDLGRKARFRNKPVFAVIQELLDIAKPVLHLSGEEDLLMPFQKLLDRDLTVAEYLRQKFAHLSKADLPKLINSLNPLAPALL
jgi:glutamate--cysteine ligase